MDSVCPSQERAHRDAKKEHRNAKRKQDGCEENQNTSVKKKLFCLPLPDDSGFSLEKDLKSEVTGLDLVKRNDAELFYLCQYWNTVPYRTDKYGIIQAHAAMASGLLDNKKYYELFLEKGFDFRICYDTTYISFCDNQAMFLEDYRQANLKIIDWRDTYSSYFPNSNIEYGNPNGLKLMIPLQDDLGYF